VKGQGARGPMMFRTMAVWERASHVDAVSGGGVPAGLGPGRAGCLRLAKAQGWWSRRG